MKNQKRTFQLQIKQKQRAKCIVSNHHFAPSFYGTRILLLIVINLSTIVFVEPSSGQNLHEAGSVFLKAHFPAKMDIPESFKFDRELSTNGLTIMESDNPPCFIAFATGETGRRVAAYSTQNLFGIDSLNQYPAMDLLNEIRDNPRAKVSFKQGMTRKHSEVGPLLKTQWDQGKWYNRFCPYYNASHEEDHVLAGCIAVAMGQIVRYYGKWNNFIIDETYVCHTIGGQELCASSTGYNWEGMINKPLNYDPEICRFLSDIGILVNMNYGPSMSTQGTGFARKAFEKIGYLNASRIQKNKYELEEWLDIFYSNLDNFCPILVSGTGHAFVCDGYNGEGMLHFNLGAGGLGDGFYDHGAIAGRYYISDAIVDLFPNSDLQAPSSLHRETSVDGDCIVWSRPFNEQGTDTGFTIYFSDSDYFFTQDTVLRIDDLRPGTHGVMVSAKQGEIESLCAGPIWIYNQGEAFTTSDPELIKSLAEQIEGVDQNSDYLIIEEGKLADMKCIKIAGRLQSTDLLTRMPNLQELELNCEGLDQDDINFISGLNSLQTLKLKNLHTETRPDFQNNLKLAEISLDSCKLKNTSFLSLMENLFVLELKDCEIDSLGIDYHLPFLETLIINNMPLENSLFINAFTHLRKLELSGCELTEFGLITELPKLRSLVLDNNKISSSNFLSYLPDLTDISMVGNRIDKFEINSEHACLTKIDFSYNRIADAAILSGVDNLVELYLSHNNLERVPIICNSASKLKVLNLSNNSIRNLPATRIHSLKNLNLSSNQLNHISGIDILEGITTLNLSSNAISDFSPFLSGEACRNLFNLDIRENPVSKQSFLEVLPVMMAKISLFNAPDRYEVNSPCYPQPESPNFVENSSMVELSWYCENNDPEISYNLYLGEGGEQRLAQSQLKTNKAQLDLNYPQIYSWQVEAILPDTSFFSGVYEIRTSKNTQLPYYEIFDRLTTGDQLTACSALWRYSNGSNGAISDGIITDVNNLEGEGNALHVQNSTHLTVDFIKTETETMIVEYDHYLIPGKGAHVCLKNISGLNLDLFSDGYRSTVFLNGSFMKDFEVLPNSWNHFRVTIKGISEMVYLSCNGQTAMMTEVPFHRNKVYIGSLEISSGDQGFREIKYGEYESYIDNIAVYDPNNKISTIDLEPFENPVQLTVYPNPAADYFIIEGLPSLGTEYDFELRNNLGQLVLVEKVEPDGSQLRISTESIPPGVYYYLFSNNHTSYSTGKIIISK